MGVHDYGCIIYGNYQFLNRFQDLESEDEGDEPSGSVDDYDPILEIYIFPGSLEINPENLTDHIRSKTYKEMFIEKDTTYSWDDWEFEPSLGHRFTNIDCEAVWEISLEDDENNDVDRENLQSMFPSIDFSMDYQIWVRNISTDAYNRYISCKIYNEDITMSELCHVYEVLGLGEDKLSKCEKYEKIQHEIMRRYNF